MLKFEEYHINVPVPIRVYADFESINQPTNRAQLAATLSSQDPKILFKQIPVAVGFHLISPFGNQYCSYFGEGCVTRFVNEMLTLEKIASACFETNIPLEMTPKEEDSFQQSTLCCLREKALRDSPLSDTLSASGEEVRDHDHLTEKYRGAAHNRCNLNCKKSQVRLFPSFFIISVVMIVI